MEYLIEVIAKDDIYFNSTKRVRLTSLFRLIETMSQYDVVFEHNDYMNLVIRDKTLEDWEVQEIANDYLANITGLLAGMDVEVKMTKN